MVENYKKMYMFDLKLTNYQRRGEWTDMIYKDIYKEYYVWSLFALVGNIGGIMGMTVGFSFIGIIGWALNSLFKKCHKGQSCYLCTTQSE